MIAWMGNLFRHRALAEILIGRDLKARYRGTVLGFLWSFASPLLMMLIYMLVFGVYMRIDQENYAIFLLCGLLPWTAFVSGINEGMGAMLANGGIIKKVHLPLEIFPLVGVTTNLVHFVLSIPVILALSFASGLAPSWHVLALPLVALLQFVFTYALALFFASLAVQFRDVVHIVPNLLMVWFYMTPVIYPAKMVPERFQALMVLNPMTWIIESYRDILFEHRLPNPSGLLGLTAVVSLSLVFGAWVFHRRIDLYPEII